MGNRLSINEPVGTDIWDGVSALAATKKNEPPASRLEYGLRIAIEWGQRHGVPLDVMEERRLELAYARIAARERGQDEMPSLGSLDYARMLVVDASVQREAEHSLQLDILDRQDYYSWANTNIENAQWMVTGTSPSRFTEFGESDLVALASGRFNEISDFQRESVEVMLLRAATPRSSELDAQLMYSAAASNGVEPEYLEVYLKPTDMDRLRRNFDYFDASEFGESRSASPISKSDFAAYVDRIGVANIADQARGRQGKALYDGRASIDGLQIADAKREPARNIVMSAGDGDVRNRMEQAVRVSLEWQQNEGVPLDVKATMRLERAVARFLSNPQQVGMTDIDIAKILIVDAGMQKLASEKLDGKASAEQTVAMLEKILGRGEVPGFTTMQREREETEAIARGRYAELTDRSGLGSAVKGTLHRSGRYAGAEVEDALERIFAANPIGRANDRGWIDRNANRLEANRHGGVAGVARMQSLARGPGLDFPLKQDRSRGR